LRFARRSTDEDEAGVCFSRYFCGMRLLSADNGEPGDGCRASVTEVGARFWYTVSDGMVVSVWFRLIMPNKRCYTAGSVDMYRSK
jgi:hypothetical protein